MVEYIEAYLFNSLIELLCIQNQTVKYFLESVKLINLAYIILNEHFFFYCFAPNY